MSASPSSKRVRVQDEAEAAVPVADTPTTVPIKTAFALLQEQNAEEKRAENLLLLRAAIHNARTSTHAVAAIFNRDVFKNLALPDDAHEMLTDLATALELMATHSKAGLNESKEIQDATHNAALATRALADCFLATNPEKMDAIGLTVNTWTDLLHEVQGMGMKLAPNADPQHALLAGFFYGKATNALWCVQNMKRVVGAVEMWG